MDRWQTDKNQQTNRETINMKNQNNIDNLQLQNIYNIIRTKWNTKLKWET